MDHTSKEIKSDTNSHKNTQTKKRNFSLTNNNSLRNAQISSNSKNSKEYNLYNNPHSVKASQRKSKKNIKEEKQSPKVISSMEYQENKIKNNLESLHKRYQREIADIIKFELDKQLLNFKLNKEEQKFKEEYNNINYNSLDNNMFLSFINKEKNKENEKEDIKDINKNKINEQQSKSKEKKENKEDNLIKKPLPPKPLRIINEKNFHENFYLMEQAKKHQIYEMNELKKQKKLEKIQKMNKIKAEQTEMKKRLESERAFKNLQKNNYDLYMRKNNIQNQIEYKELFAFHYKQTNNEKRNEEIKKNKENEKIKYDHIKKMRLNEEKNRINFYIGLIEKEKKKEKKKLENVEIKDMLRSQYKELNEIRNNNIMQLKKLLKNGIDEGNIEKLYKKFPENKEIVKVFENYQKERKEIETNSFRNKEKTKLDYFKKNTDDNIENKYSKTTYDFKNKTIKIPKIKITDNKPNTNRNNDLENNKENIDIKKENNEKENKEKTEREKEESKNEKNNLINICSTNKNDKKDIKKENIGNIKNKEDNKNNNGTKKSTNKKDNLNENKEETKKVLFETEIREKIKEYKKERYQPFIKMLEREKIIEENRNKQLEDINDDIERMKLENQFGKERTLVSLRLKKENEKVLLDIQNFEKQLREENERNQKYNMYKINILK